MLFLNWRILQFELSFQILCVYSTNETGTSTKRSCSACITQRQIIFILYSLLKAYTDRDIQCIYNISLSFSNKVLMGFEHFLFSFFLFFQIKSRIFHMVAESICHYVINLSKACSIKTLIAATLATISPMILSPLFFFFLH